MSPRVPRLRWDDPFRALDMLASLWSSTGMSLVSAGAAQAVAAPYRTLFTTLQQLLIGKEVTVRIGDHDVVLTVTELDSALEPQRQLRSPLRKQRRELQTIGCEADVGDAQPMRQLRQWHSVGRCPCRQCPPPLSGDHGARSQPQCRLGGCARHVDVDLKTSPVGPARPAQPGRSALGQLTAQLRRRLTEHIIA